MKPSEFKEWRARLGLTQEKAADHLGCKLITIKAYENGRRTPGLWMRILMWYVDKHGPAPATVRQATEPRRRPGKAQHRGS